VNKPDVGTLIRSGSGLRKIRWVIEGRGKRGGVRLIYFWAVPRDQLLLLLMYPKNERDVLTPDQLKRLRSIIETEYP